MMMVKFGEFSPLNPDLQCTGRTLLGLGEYEEKRRILLEKKKREYREQMVQARALQKTGNRLRGRSHVKNGIAISEAVVYENQFEDCYGAKLQSKSQNTRLSTLDKQCDVAADGQCLPFVSTLPEMNPLELKSDEFSLPPLSPDTLSISARDRKLADLRQSFSEMPLSSLSLRNDSLAALSKRSRELYQEELRQQIEEKRRLEAEQKEREKREEEAIARRLAKQQEQMQREYEWEEAQRKAVAEKYTQQLEESLHHQEKFEREATELRKKTKWKFEEPQKSYFNMYSNSHSIAVTKVRNLLTPASFKPGHCKDQQNRQPHTSNLESALSETIRDYTVNDEEIMHLKLFRSEKRYSNEVGMVTHRVVNLHSPPLRNCLPCDQTEGEMSVQFQRNRIPLKMIHNLEEDHNLEDTLPIPVFRSRSPVVPAVRHRSSLELASESPVSRRHSDGMQMLMSKWQVPAVQKNNLQTTDRFQQLRHNNELTQLGAFRRQLQMEQLRMDKMLQQQQCVKKV